jgi:uncharacterized membrane protein YebE (DUF533 family)
MDAEHILGSLLGAALRGKRHRRARRYLAGGRGSLINPTTILGALGVAWGVFETMQKERAAAGPPGTPAGPAGAGTPPRPATPPLPPLPRTPEELAGLRALRQLRLIVAAARADGRITDAEREELLAQARGSGLEAVLQAELGQARPLAEAVAGAADAEEKRDLYRLAFGIVRADEEVTGGERILLARLAHLLGLEPAAVAELEKATAAGIDAAGDAEEGETA